MRLIALVVALLLTLGCDSRPSPSPATRNLNQATVAELEALPNIGSKKARSIVASRNARGGQFKSFDEILAIDGIGPETVDELRARFVLGPRK